MILDERTGIGLALAQCLRTLGCRVRLIEPAFSFDSVPAEVAGAAILLPCGPLDASALWKIVRAIQRLRLPLHHNVAHRPRLLFVQRLDGSFGLGNGDEGEFEPSQAALAGLAKTLHHEWPECQVRVVDLHPALETCKAAELLAAEWAAAGPLEVGLTFTGRVTPFLEPASEPTITTNCFQPDDLFLVTGGARGITATVARHLAIRGARRFVILGRSSVESQEPSWLAQLTDEREIKRAMMEHAPRRISPRELQRQSDGIFAAREARANLELLTRMQAEVHYRAVDLRDGAVVAQILKKLQDQLGPITGLIHAAGVLADRRVEDLDEDGFRRVYSTKVDGFANVWRGIDPAQLKWCMLFSSLTARLGRAGQAAYAMANEVLNKQAQNLRQRQPHLRVQAINWGPWEGGMVRGALRERFAQDGIGLIPLDAGADLACDELCAAEARPTELVVLASGQAPKELRNAQARTLRSERVAGEREFVVSLAEYPLLNDHRLSGRPVVPVAIALDWFAAEARQCCPQLRFVGFDNVRVAKGIVLDDGQALSLRLAVETPRRDGNELYLPMSLATASTRGRWQPRIAATVVLADPCTKRKEGQVFERTCGGTASVDHPRFLSHADGNALEPSVAYGVELFHGPAFRMIQSINECSQALVVVRALTQRALPSWKHCGYAGSSLVDPLILDATFQAMVVWSQRQIRKPALPVGFNRYRQDAALLAEAEVSIVARLTKQSNSRLAADLAIYSLDERLLAVMEGCECIASPTLHAAFAGGGQG